MEKRKLLTRIIAGAALGIMVFSSFGTLLFYLLAF